MVAKNMSIADLERELAERQQHLASLEKQHKDLLRQVEAVESEMASIRGSGKAGRRRGPGRPKSKASSNGRRATGRRGRGQNELTLPDAIAEAMEKGAVVSPKEVAQLVRDNGYKTTSKTFGVQVGTALANDGRFKRVGRGQYERVR